MAQQKIFKSRLSAKDLMKFSGMSEKGRSGAVSSSPRWQYYAGSGGSQRIVIHHNERSQVGADHFHKKHPHLLLADRKHVTRVSVNANYPCYQSRSLSDLRLLPDVTSSVSIVSKRLQADVTTVVNKDFDLPPK